MRALRHFSNVECRQEDFYSTSHVFLSGSIQFIHSGEFAHQLIDRIQNSQRAPTGAAKFPY